MRVALILAASLSFLSASRALANGAFPDSLAIFAPADQPGRIIAATNFGIFSSDDDGATWSYLCEEAIAPNAYNYQLGPPPMRALYAVSVAGLAVSRDDVCTFAYAEGFDEVEVIDAFPDPTEADHVLAIGRMRVTNGTYSVYESRDGFTFPTRLYEGEIDRMIQSVEISRMNSQRIVLSSWKGFPPNPFVHVSDNAGMSFETFDFAPHFGNRIALIAAIDPQNQDRIYFRVLSTTASGDSLGISEDGGRTGRIVYEPPAKMAGFLRLPDGTMIVPTVSSIQYISTNDGMTFSQWNGAPHIRAIAHRDGAIYAATSEGLDGYTVGVTRDLGMNWTPLLKVVEHETIRSCPGVDHEARCRVPLMNAIAVLTGQPPIPGPDAGPVPTDAGTTDAGAINGGGDNGCGCTTTQHGAGAALSLILLALLRRRHQPSS